MCCQSARSLAFQLCLFSWSKLSDSYSPRVKFNVGLSCVVPVLL